MMAEASPPVTAEWIWVLRGASRLLALGSVCLLVGGLVLVGGIVYHPLGFGILLLIIVTIAGFVLHLFGWVSLNDAALWPAMRVTFVLSLGGFAVGAATFLYLVPQLGLFLLFGGWLLLPYMPFVWGPVAIAHAILFLLFYERLGRGAPLLIVGGLALGAIAAIGLAFQFAFVVGLPTAFGLDLGLSNWMTVFAGLTSIGYGIGALEFASQYEARHVSLRPFLQNPQRFR